MRLKGLKTIVTGGGGERGIGRAIVRAFGKEGADVCVVGRNKEAGLAAVEDVKACGGQAMSVQCNISEYDEIKNVVDTVLSEWGRIDVLVNNAGISSIRHFVDLTPEEVERVWKVNFFGTFFMQQLVCKHMIERAEKAGYKPGDPIVGKIINHSSISEKVGASHLTHYAPTKAAIMMLTKSTALDLAKYGILVNALGTGVVDTNIAAEDVQPGDYEEALKMIPMQRLGKPEDIANLAVFLASNESDYMTGTTVMCDGGYTAQ